MTGQQDAEAPSVKRFTDWLRHGGATIPSLEIRTVNGLRGTYATRKIHAGELIYHIPRHLMVTAEMAQNSPIGTRISAQDMHISQIGYITAFLLQNHREKGFWSPCIDVMPKRASSLIAFHRHKHVNLLKGGMLRHGARPQNSTIREAMWKDYLGIRPYFEALTLHEFTTLYILLLTRLFYIDLDGTKSIAMVPFADMPNHTTPEHIKWFPFASQGMVCVALQNIESGAEVYGSYGKKTNGELLFHYGFCLENNLYSLVEITLPDLKPAHPFFEQTKTWGERRGRDRLFRISRNQNAFKTRELFSYLRMACLEDFPSLQKASATSTDGIVPEISKQNELAALSILSLACHRHLSQFDRTLEEDEQLLSDPTLDWTERCAIMVGQGEKRILQHYLTLTNIIKGRDDDAT